MPLSLNDSEFQFVTELCKYAKKHKSEFAAKGQEIYLLRNLSRGKGVGFAEASNFHPDFILWVVEGEKQYITFIEPHGMHNEKADNDKVKFCRRVKDIEKRLGDPNVILNSYIISPTPYQGILWIPTPLKPVLEEQDHILFMEDGGESYLPKMFSSLTSHVAYHSILQNAVVFAD